MTGDYSSLAQQLLYSSFLIIYGEKAPSIIGGTESIVKKTKHISTSMTRPTMTFHKPRLVGHTTNIYFEKLTKGVFNVSKRSKCCLLYSYAPRLVEMEKKDKPRHFFHVCEFTSSSLYAYRMNCCFSSIENTTLLTYVHISSIMYYIYTTHIYDTHLIMLMQIIIIIPAW